LIKHGPHWINFTIFTFISENNTYFRCLYKIWNKIISFDMRKKRENVRHVIGKVKKKVNLKVLAVSPKGSNVVPQSCLDLNMISRVKYCIETIIECIIQILFLMYMYN
jgi:hypothetical protein